MAGIYLTGHMTPDQQQFLALRHHPARLTALQTAWVLGFALHDIPVLAAKGLLRPLGNPAPNGQKYFATRDVDALRNDSAWLSKASKAMTSHWKSKNARAKGEPPDS